MTRGKGASREGREHHERGEHHERAGSITRGQAPSLPYTGERGKPRYNEARKRRTCLYSSDGACPRHAPCLAPLSPHHAHLPHRHTHSHHTMLPSHTVMPCLSLALSALAPSRPPITSHNHDVNTIVGDREMGGLKGQMYLHTSHTLLRVQIRQCRRRCGPFDGL